MDVRVSSGVRLRTIIEMRGSSQAETGRMAGIDRSDITKFVKDKKMPTTKQMIRIAEVLKVDSRAIWP